MSRKLLPKILFFGDFNFIKMMKQAVVINKKIVNPILLAL